MPSDAFLQIRTALDTTTEVSGGDARSGVGAVFIQKEIDRMIRETKNKSVDFSPLVQRKTIRQLAYIWNLETGMGSTAKGRFYTDGATGVPYPNQYLQLFAPAKALRSDYEVTGLTLAASASYFDALEREARTALQVLALLEEQAFILGDDASAETSGICYLTNTVGVSGSYKGLKQLLSSAVAVAAGYQGGFADASSVYGSTRSSTVTDREYALNCKTVVTNGSSTTPLTTDNLNAAITTVNIAVGKKTNRIFLVSERRMDEITNLIAPLGRYVIGASSVELDGGQRILTWRGYKIISSRFMAFLGVTSSDATSVTFADADNCVLLLDMDDISFYNVAGVDARHHPIMGADASQRSDVEGGYFKTYGTFVMERFNSHCVIWNLSTP
jgi:hypothetical protein